MSNLISQAQKQIAGILANLEKEADVIVKSIEFDDVDVTCGGDDRPKLRRKIFIECERLPGHGWEV